VLRAYAECDLVVFASTYEGFGMPIIEANAIGRVVVTSNCRPMCDVAGSAACLVDPYDPLSIREGVCRVITHAEYRDALIQRGYDNVARFRAAEIAVQYADIYRGVLNGKVPGPSATDKVRHVG
jgi:glycosyltransferase involved in cell wall biosynthesis